MSVNSPLPFRAASLLVGLLVLGACASSPPEPIQPGTAPQPAVAADMPLAEPPLAPASRLDELETRFAAYEQQLARNEARLQAMGVRVAQRAQGEAAGAEDADERFAPPPPAAPGDAVSRNDSPRSARPATRKKSARPAEDQAPAPSSRPKTSGYGRSGGDAAEAKRAEQGRGRCDELCELAGSTCELEAKICELAARHPDEPRYEQVCQRADEHCRLASDACARCSP